MRTSSADTFYPGAAAIKASSTLQLGHAFGTGSVVAAMMAMESPSFYF